MRMVMDSCLPRSHRSERGIASPVGRCFRASSLAARPVPDEAGGWPRESRSVRKSGSFSWSDTLLDRPVARRTFQPAFTQSNSPLNVLVGFCGKVVEGIDS